MIPRTNLSIHCAWYLMLLVCLSGCRKNDPNPDYPVGSNENINRWVLDSMKVYYYWNGNLPAKPDLSAPPLDFFSRIKNPADRFSELVNLDLPNSYLQNMTRLFGVDIVAVEANSEVGMYVTLVIPGSDAEFKGLKRGQRITSVNGVVPNSQNTNTIIQNAIDAKAITLNIQSITAPISLSATFISENPVHAYKILGTNSKTAYIFLNSFELNGISPLLTAFNNFKGESVSELIVDLRYNPGGDVSMAALLAAIIAPVKAADVFGEYRGNVNAGIRKNTFAKELSYISYTVDQLIGYRLPLRRVYILTGKHTASAAELLANNLSPYIEVIRIGEQTLGKDMASFEIKDLRNPVKVDKWVIHPLVYKLYNANGQGDYPQGLKPAITINELQYLPFKPVGDPSDPLISAAIDHISGRKLFSLKQPDIKPSMKILLDTRNKIDAQSSADNINK